MIQPIRCFTCGKVIADQIDYYNTEKKKKEQENKTKKEDDVIEHFDKIHTKDILDNLGLTRYCCRRMFITDIDLMNII
tara:strand:+ start:1451 stop:1684 length:234 start_codon:yes stop_codon:yes gene_type:complete